MKWLLAFIIFLFVLVPSTFASGNGDLNGSGTVDLLDFNLLISKFGDPYTLLDFNHIILNFGKIVATPPPTPTPSPSSGIPCSSRFS